MAELRRKMRHILDEWDASGHKKAFLLVGARQTGKTYVIRRFAAQQSKHLAEVNFLEQPDLASVLAASASAEDFISRLTLATGVSANVEEMLIFLDEIQEAPELITAVKFVVEDGRCPIVLSGSMLGTELKGYRSFPVGYVQIERMFPLDFEEFCWALGIAQQVVADIREAYDSRRRLDAPLHEQLMRTYRYFIAIGGMPEVVSIYLDSGYNVGAARETAASIVEQYRFDIAKYNEKRGPQIRAVYNAVPSQLDKKNKRFRMDALKKGAEYDRYANDFAWLIDAAVVLPTYQVSEPKRPLQRTAQANKFKLYESDTGLLLSQYDPKTTLDVVNNESTVNFGAVYENAVAQALACENPALYYFDSNRKGEVDFLVTLNDGSVLPVEVKSGKDYKLHTALNNLLSTQDYGIDEACVLSSRDVEKGERAGKPVWYLPLYMAFCIAENANGKLGEIRLRPPEIER